MQKPLLFGRYLLLEQISVGGMAEIFKAKSFGTDGFANIVAMKRILPSMAEDSDFISMFIDEAKISVQLSHPNICQIYDLGCIDSSHYIVMEYVQGRDVLQIENRFRRMKKRMPPQMAALIAAKICEGLDYAHRKRDSRQQPLNIIHRDVSPQNILVSYEGEVKIIDFGIAKAVSRSSKTQAGVLKGKFGYMSPEQVRGEHLDHRSDIFAIGTLLWEMCTEKRLFSGPSDFAVLEKVRNATVPPPSAHNPMIPPELEAIIMRALHRDVAERYQWATEMQEALQGYLMTKSPPWNAATLAKAMKQIFNEERQRERESVQKYLAIKEADLQGYDVEPSARRGRGTSLAKRETEALTGGRDVDYAPISAPAAAEKASSARAANAEGVGFDDDDNRTEIGGPSFLDNDEVKDSDHLPALAPNSPADTHDNGNNGDNEATRVVQQGSFSETPGLPAEPTHVFEADLAGDESAGPVSEGAPSELIPTAPKSSIHGTAQRDTTQAGTSTASVKGRRSSVLKDILIGVLSATVLILLGLVLWTMIGHSRQGQRATVVVSAPTSSGSAEVVLDGKSLGRVDAKRPLTLRDITPGGHRVALLPDVGEPVARRFNVSVAEVRVLTFSFAKTPHTTPMSPGSKPAVAQAAPGVRVSPSDGQRDQPTAGKADTSATDTGSAGRDSRAAQPSTPPKATAPAPKERKRRRRRARAVPVKQATRRKRREGTPAPGFLVSNTIPWSEIWIDGKDSGRTTPITPSNTLVLAPGPHRVTFVAKGQRFSHQIVIRSGKTTRLIKKLPLK